MNPTISWNALEGAGVGQVGNYTVEMQVISSRSTVTAFTTLAVTKPALMPTANGSSTATVGVPYTVNFSALNWLLRCAMYHCPASTTELAT